MGILGQLFKSEQDKRLGELEEIKERILSLEDKYSKMSDEELTGMTKYFKQQLIAGKRLEDIREDAFAVCREAQYRVLGMKQYPVQVLAGLVLNDGSIAEMNTGEGKTLMETLPAYLNALEQKGVHIVTVNEYLAERDCNEMGKIFKYLGLSVGLIKQGMQTVDRQLAYKCDITYVTNSELGFDYLKDNMAESCSKQVHRGLNYCIVDEIDSVLIDDAGTPLVIQTDSDESVDDYYRADKFAKTLELQVIQELESEVDIDEQAKGDYIYEEKNRIVELTAKGIAKAEQWFKCGSLSDESNLGLRAKINQAIKANGCMKKDIDYIVVDNEIQIVDQNTGRVLKGRRYNDGLHQAIEAKEGVKVNKETTTGASITYQNFFRMYNKLCGMQGTARTSEEEFREIYGLSVLKIPTNKQSRRLDHKDEIYINKQAKHQAIIQQVRKCNSNGQPVLVGTQSIADSEELQKLLQQFGIKHSVLNAKNHKMEAEIIQQAGKFGAVTIATNMAGRGTDIKLGGLGASPEEKERVHNTGGLYVIGTDRNESQRVDGQLRGRAGRQGDPGESKFILQLDDDTIKLFGGDRITKIQASLQAFGLSSIENNSVHKLVDKSQKTVEGLKYQRRKHMFELDQTLDKQRDIIYKQREQILKSNAILELQAAVIKRAIEHAQQLYLTDAGWDLEGFRAYFIGWLITDKDFCTTKEAYLMDEGTDQIEYIGKDDLRDILVEKARKALESRVEQHGLEVTDQFMRRIMLKIVDKHWKIHLENMEALKKGIDNVKYASKDPVIEYRIAGFEIFDDMLNQMVYEMQKVIILAKLK